MHEWEGKADSRCSWCGSEGRILEKETSFEKFVKAISQQEDMPPKYQKLANKHFWELI